MNQHDTIPVFDGQVNSLPITELPDSSISRANNLTGDHAHYESKAFSVQLGINSLASAAAPLLHIAMQLRHQQHQPDLDKLFKALSYEIHTMEYRVHASDYPQQVIIGARYLVCALVDEIILQSAWGRDSSWQQQTLLNHFHQDSWGGERFFIILERCSQNPASYIDLLELGYLCLSLGFKGKYQNNNNAEQLEHIIDNLYKLIRRHRDDFPRFLAIDVIPPVIKQKNYWRMPGIRLTVILTCVILASIFLPYYYHLQHLAQPLYQIISNDPEIDSTSGSN